MTEAQLRDLIRQVIAELGGTRPDDAPPAERPTALVLFSGALLGFEAACGSLARLVSEVNLDWIQTDSARRILDQDAINAIGMTPAEQSLVASHDMLIIPTLTVNLASKVANGIGDCLASNVMAEFIMSAKPVVAATNAVCPDGPDKLGWFPNMPAGYRDMLRRNLAALRSFEVRLCDASRLDGAVRRSAGTTTASPVVVAEKLVTEATVAGHADGAVIHLQPRAIVTHLAREAAARRGITLREGA